METLDTMSNLSTDDSTSIVQTKMKPMGFLEPFPEVDSGYSSWANSPEIEFPEGKLDWRILCKELDNLLITSTPLDPRVIEPPITNYTFQECQFSLEGLQSKDNLDEPIVVIRITGPSGLLYPVTVKTDYGVQRCTFFPVEVGKHIGIVTLNGVHIQGSPFEVNFSRDYSKISRPIVTMDVEIPGLADSNGQIINVRKPWGIACNITTEQILVADREHHEVLVFTPTGDLEFTFGRRGSGPGEFFRPTSIAYDSKNGRIIVGDKDNHRIQIFNDKGIFMFSFGGRGFRSGYFSYPWGLAVSKCGNYIIVADTRNHRIQLFNKSGAFLRQYPPRPTRGEFNHPRGITFDLTGEHVYVSDFNLNCIFKLDIDFRTCFKIVDETILKRPQGLVIDDAGNLLVTDSRHNSVKVFQPDGTFLQEFTKISSTMMIDLPLDLSVMRAGFLSILDLNGRINIV